MKLRTVLILVLLCAALAALILFSRPKRPNLILIGLDTLRADHLGIYGYERNTSPHLDQFARENTRFNYALTAAPWTPPSFASVFTGLFASAHGMMPPNSRDLARKRSTKLDQGLDTLAEIFSEHGYTTMGLTPNPWLKKEFGFQQGFENFKFLERAVAGQINKAAFKMIDELAAKRSPFFLFLHYLDPHDPYTPPAPFDSMFSGELKSRSYDVEMMGRINKYDGEIAYLDSELGKLFQYLKDKDLYGSSLIVIFGDHGEQFKEHGHFTHGFNLFNEELHVPLLLKDNRTVREVDYTVSTVDIFPTLLELAKIPVPKEAQGVSLLNDENFRHRSGVISEILRKFNQKSLTSFEGQKLIRDFSMESGLRLKDLSQGKTVGVFDRKQNYFEDKPLENQTLQYYLQSELESNYKHVLQGQHQSTQDTEFGDDTLEQLKSLGYLQ